MIGKNSSAQPALRFPEFSGDWIKADIDWFLEKSSKPVSVKLGQTYQEIGVRSHGKGIFHKTADIGETLGDKRVFWVVPNALVLNIVFAWEQAVALTTDREAGFIASHRFPMFIPRENRADTRFARDFFLRPRGKWLLELASPGGAGRNKTLGQSNFAELPVVWPSQPEQKEIADFLGAVDERIKLLQRRRDALARYKTGIMQCLFDQSLRFTRDDGTAFPDWEELTLGNVAKFSKGRGISKDDIVPDGVQPCIRYGELYTVYGEKISNVVSKTNSPPESLLLSKPGDVVLPASGETPMDMPSASCVLAGGVALGGDITVIRSPINGVFLAYLLRSHKRRAVARLAQGNSVVHLYGVHLASLKLDIPTDPDEQCKIADALSALDDKIAAVTAQIKLMQTFKKGLLQQMFV